MAVEFVRDLYAIIPAGGTGKRLWPLARVHSPKFLKDMSGTDSSLLQDTAARAELVCPPDHILVVTGRDVADQVREQLPQLPAGAVLEEPVQRQSMSAVALAAAVVARRDPDAIVAVLPADHTVDDPEAMAVTIRQAAEVARMGRVVSVGVDPVAPATSFGYIAMGDTVEAAGIPDVRAVVGFEEKPEPEQAQKFVMAGRYLWNTGILVSRADVLLRHLARLRPELAEAVAKVAEAWETDPASTLIDDIWPGLPKEGVDRALAIPLANEKVGVVIQGHFRWDDVRDLRSLADSLERRLDGLKVLGADSAVSVDSRGGLVVSTTDRQIVILGLDDAVVVDTPDALLVTTGSRCKDVPTAVAELAALERNELL